ncbi:hypothetical protein TREES_T100015907 [Tupaia chinensis]|uniref:Uncharacterized protein n=1 Tax=Tupaia chinensis TaxID=246437 RepID=L9KWZ2_TUPCH|nr:hypothetical protein TREES_T100015907 [Tupaia chinensis]
MKRQKSSDFVFSTRALAMGCPWCISKLQFGSAAIFQRLSLCLSQGQPCSTSPPTATATSSSHPADESPQCPPLAPRENHCQQRHCLSTHCNLKVKHPPDIVSSHNISFII